MVMKFSRRPRIFTYCTTGVSRYTIWETQHCGLYTRTLYPLISFQQ